MAGNVFIGGLMFCCEKCWEDAYSFGRSHGMGQPEAYNLLLELRKDKPCSEKEQAGQFWDEEKQIDRRISNEMR